MFPSVTFLETVLGRLSRTSHALPVLVVVVFCNLLLIPTDEGMPRLALVVSCGNLLWRPGDSLVDLWHWHQLVCSVFSTLPDERVLAFLPVGVCGRAVDVFFFFLFY